MKNNQFTLDELKQLCTVMVAYRHQCEAEVREFANSPSVELKEFKAQELLIAENLFNRVIEVYSNAQCNEHPEDVCFSADDLIL